MPDVPDAGPGLERIACPPAPWIWPGEKELLHDLSPRTEGRGRRTRQGILMADRGSPAPSPPRAGVVPTIRAIVRQVPACSRLRILPARRHLTVKLNTK